MVCVHTSAHQISSPAILLLIYIFAKIGKENFHAHTLHPQIRSRVPPGIGVLVYYSGPNFFGIRKKIEAEYRELSGEKQKWLILSIAKRHNKYLKQRLKEAQERIRRDEIF